jgi:hypothetical protein
LSNTIRLPYGRVLENKVRVKRKYPVLGQVRDVEGGLWDVREIRDTKYGFDLLFGSPVSRLGIEPSGLPRLIATKALKEFWDVTKTRHDGLIFDLPAGRTTLKRVRRRLGFNHLKDQSKFWNERIHDLKTLSAREFSARHDVNVEVVFDRRTKLIGRRARQLGWWRKPRALKILLSDITLREIGEKLNIGTSQAKRLRDRARQLQES